MDKKNKKFCYIDVNFPKDILIAFAFFRVDGKSLIYPLYETFFDLKKISKSLKVIKKKIEGNNKGVDVFAGLVVKLEYDHSFPLKKEYWDVSQNPNLNINTRVPAFLKMLNGPQPFFWVVLTPALYGKKTKTWELSNWLPIRITSTDEQIEGLIKSSDQFVDSRSKSIGMYSVVKIQGFDFEKGELAKPSDEIDLPEANC